MAYIPPKSKRQYQNPLFTQALESKAPHLVAHDCAKCRVTFSNNAKGVWFERADHPGAWCWVCQACCDNARSNRLPPEATE